MVCVCEVIIENGDVCCDPRLLLRVLAEFARGREGSSLDTAPQPEATSSVRKSASFSLLYCSRFFRQHKFHLLLNVIVCSPFTFTAPQHEATFFCIVVAEALWLE